ncbi:MAG: hypothetical protein HYS52_01280 [Candidatus Wildermuthbacteria bacterium]|nr:hypothetical protein [Candidatus Wildermuthbacteria bacterium]
MEQFRWVLVQDTGGTVELCYLMRDDIAKSCEGGVLRVGAQIRWDPDHPEDAQTVLKVYDGELGALLSAMAVMVDACCTTDGIEGLLALLNDLIKSKELALRRFEKKRAGS